MGIPGLERVAIWVDHQELQICGINVILRNFIGEISQLNDNKTNIKRLTIDFQLKATLENIKKKNGDIPEPYMKLGDICLQCYLPKPPESS